ncbi:tyrosine phosphatase-like protein [Globomyces pollinis-pini]|nr:tyrosine phosphatase-like protein [Globomyces pollinis-pini]
MAKTKSEKPVNSLVNLYLIVYNVASCVGWSAVLASVALHYYNGNTFTTIYPNIALILNVVQTAATLEIFHSLVGFVKADPFPTIVQVFSRLGLCWGILDLFNDPLVRESEYVTSMVVAWSLTEIVRYSHFAATLSLGKSPYITLWLRYTCFYVLYPLGAGSEFLLIRAALDTNPSSNMSILLQVLSGFYPPGFYFMYTHMMKQRVKYLATNKKKKQE